MAGPARANSTGHDIYVGSRLLRNELIPHLSGCIINVPMSHYKIRHIVFGQTSSGHFERIYRHIMSLKPIILHIILNYKKDFTCISIFYLILFILSLVCSFVRSFSRSFFFRLFVRSFFLSFFFPLIR